VSDIAPPAALTPDSFAERLYTMMEPLARQDFDNAWSLLTYCNAIGSMYQLVDDWVRDTPDGPGWSLLLDLDRCPAVALPWLAQLVGVRLLAGSTEADQRARIASTDGFKRGTVAAMRGAAQPTLIGSQTLLFRERSGDTAVSPDYAYYLDVTTYANETPWPITGTTPLALTVSGNEITDTTRLAAVQGDSGGVVNVTNVCTNGGFETDVTGWTVDTFYGGAAAVARDTTRSKYGTACAKITPTVAKWMLQGPAGPTATAAGLVFIASAWVYADSTAVGKVLSLDCLETGTGQTRVTVTLVAGWQRLVTPPLVYSGSGQAVRARLVDFASAFGSGTLLYLDGVQVEQSSVARDYVDTNGAQASAVQPGYTVANLCTNSGFESNTTGWAVGGTGTIARDTTLARSGVASLKVTPVGGLDGATYAIRLPTGTYTISCWLWASVGQTIRFSTQAVASPTFTGTGGWQRISWTLTAAAGLSTVIAMQRSGGGNAPFWIDDFQIEHGGTLHDVVDTNGAIAARWVSQLLDSSYGVWESTTNLCTNGGFETNTTGWATYQAGGVLTRVTADKVFGATSLRFDMPAVGNGAIYSGMPAGQAWPASSSVTASCWFKGTAGQTFELQAICGATDATNFAATTEFVASGQWQRVIVTVTVPVGKTGDRMSVLMYKRNGSGLNTAGADSFWLDGVQVEAKAFATPYVETTAATATRAVSRVRASVASIDETQGWFAARVRLGWATAQGGVSAGQYPTLISFVDSTADRLTLRAINGQWAMERLAAGAGVAAYYTQAAVPGDVLTVIGRWTSTAVGASVNGGPFVSAANASIPTLAATQFDIASWAGGNGFMDSDVLWWTCGVGLLSDADAATLHAYGNTGPTDLTTLPGKPRMLWQADTSSALQATLAALTELPTYVALMSQKPAGIVLRYYVLAGQSWQQVKDSGKTWAQVKAAYTTWDSVRNSTPT
jgi:hypothetical protein